MIARRHWRTGKRAFNGSDQFQRLQRALKEQKGKTLVPRLMSHESVGCAGRSIQISLGSPSIESSAAKLAGALLRSSIFAHDELAGDPAL
jgi:hypothetical protein